MIINVDDLQELPWEISPTGRSIRAPNVQNIPVRTTTGKAIREAFVDSHTTTWRGQIIDAEALLQYIQAGNAALTIRSIKTGTRFTFRFRRPPEVPGKECPIFVQLLNGQDNESNYVFLGTVWSSTWKYCHSAKTHFAENVPSVQAVKWFISCVRHNTITKALAQAEFWHEGRCGRCGRKLTVPESITTGYGPECINHL